jgi:hypothetical protein
MAADGWNATTLIASVGIVVCLALQGVQTFLFAPLAGAESAYLLTVIFLFVCVATVAVPFVSEDVQTGGLNGHPLCRLIDLAMVALHL